MYTCLLSLTKHRKTRGGCPSACDCKLTSAANGNHQRRSMLLARRIVVCRLDLKGDVTRSVLSVAVRVMTQFYSKHTVWQFPYW